ncbi:MAG TPA: metallophosphoesterase [Ruminiclostridium sp.]
MKVLVMSDTHGYIINAKEAIDRNPDIEMVLHLGDYCRDAAQLSQLYPNIRFEYVYGNCDIGIGAISAEKTIEIEGKRIFMTHGHKYSVKWDYNRILAKAEMENAEVILFGHTHVSAIDNVNNILIVNPGSISESRSRNPESYSILEISKYNIKSDIVYV